MTKAPKTADPRIQQIDAVLENRQNRITYLETANTRGEAQSLNAIRKDPKMEKTTDLERHEHKAFVIDGLKLTQEGLVKKRNALEKIVGTEEERNQFSGFDSKLKDFNSAVEKADKNLLEAEYNAGVRGVEKVEDLSSGHLQVSYRRR